jgi:outer membrane lipoprotein LolB
MRVMFRRQHGSALLLSALIAGCALLPPPGALSPRPQRSMIEAYSLSGRISVRQGEVRYAAHIDWQHDASHDEILLSTPLGQGIAELTRDAAGARLVTAERREFAATDWEALSVRVFGFALPLTSLPRWLVADAPGGAARDAAGRPQHFSADGWTVDYRDYEGEAAYALPQLIEIRSDDVEVRLKIDEWQAVR